MRHFHRTHLSPDTVLSLADEFFPALGLTTAATQPRTRRYNGALGTVMLSARPEGGHYTFIEVDTNQMGESRLDRNVKRYFVRVHRMAEPSHRLQAAY